MPRPLSWRRRINANDQWPLPPSTIWNQTFPFNWDPGVTLTRTVGNVRFWTNDDQAAISGPDDLYVTYVWALVWDDGTVANMNTKSLSNNMPELQDHILHMEAFSMRDAWTPDGYAGVNIGFIDDRPETGFDVRAQRLSTPVNGRTASQVRFLAQARLVGDFFGINFAPRISISFLDRAASTV